MGLILDTSVLIAVEKNKIDFSPWQDLAESVYISSITVSELLVGVHQANSAERRLKREAFVEYLIRSITALSFDGEVARTHARLFSYLKDKGTMIGAHDLIIAATALNHGFSLLTLNEREFKQVPGLKILSAIPAHV